MDKNLILVTKKQYFWYSDLLVKNTDFFPHLRFMGLPIMYAPLKGWKVIDLRKEPCDIKIWRKKIISFEGR